MKKHIVKKSPAPSSAPTRILRKADKPRKKPWIIGLTGSIGMGKSTAARMLKDFGVPVFDADLAVHLLLAKDGAAVAKIAKIFPDSFKKGAIDRKILGQLVFGAPARLRQLEAILHPLVQRQEKIFLTQNAKARAVVLEIPLLFETGADKRCDVTIVVTAPKQVQKQRVLKRKSMTLQKFKAILAQQMPDAEKCALADFCVETSDGKACTRQKLANILARLFLTS